MSNNRINWHWNPSAASHFGGVFERMIRSVKRAVKAILRNADVNDEELQTIFIGVESLMNSRPLTQLSSETPKTVDTTAFNQRKRWRRIQELIRNVLKRWMKDYLVSFVQEQSGSKEKKTNNQRRRSLSDR